MGGCEKKLLSASCFIWYGFFETMLNAQRLTSNARYTNNYFRFEQLEVWKEAREFVTLVYKLTSKFPLAEKFGLVDQLRRAAVSIALNIAEGSTKGSDADFRRFLKMAQGSINEVVTGIYIALDQKFVTLKQFNEVYDYSLKVNAKIYALIKSVSR